MGLGGLICSAPCACGVGGLRGPAPSLQYVSLLPPTPGELGFWSLLGTWPFLCQPHPSHPPCPSCPGFAGLGWPQRGPPGLYAHVSIFCTRRERSKVPYIVRQCIEEVEKRGIEEVGIYRISGVATDIQALKAVFDASECPGCWPLFVSCSPGRVHRQRDHPQSPTLQAQDLVIALHVFKMCWWAQEEGVAGKANVQRSQPCLCLGVSEQLLPLAGFWETLSQDNIANGFANCSASHCPARRELLGSSQPQPGRTGMWT